VPETVETDRRSSPRARVDLGVSLNVDNMPILPVNALNLSASGIYCTSRDRLGELTRVDLVLRLDDRFVIPARAVVIREEELPDGSFGLGMFFTSIQDEHRALIAELVSGNRTGERS